MNKKIKKIGPRLISLFLVISLVFSNGVPVYASNDFILSSTSTSTGTNGDATIDLSWNAPPTAINPQYVVMRKDSASSDWIPISSFKDPSQPIDVLNIYAAREQENFFKNLMNDLNAHDNNGVNLYPDINVTPCHFTARHNTANPPAFNTNSHSILFDANGARNYDVIIIGFRSKNNYSDISAAGKADIQEFLNKGGGILVGHDVMASTSLTSLAPLFNIQTGKAGNNSEKIVSDKVKVIKAGPATSYPYNLVNKSFNVATTHTNGQVPIDYNNVYVAFEKNANNGTTFGSINPYEESNSEISDNSLFAPNGWTEGGKNINSFLHVYNNTAMIQTGNWNNAQEAQATAEITLDEMKLIGNTIFYLAQTTSANQTKDYIHDFVKPTIPTYTYDQDTREIAFSATDNPHNYEYRVVAIPAGVTRPTSQELQTTLNNPASETYNSCFISTTAGPFVSFADLDGFIYTVTNVPTTEPEFGAIGTGFKPISDATFTVLPSITPGKWLHVAAKDKNGNVGPTLHIDLDATFPVINTTVTYEFYDNATGSLITSNIKIDIDYDTFDDDSDNNGIITIPTVQVGSEHVIVNATVEGYSFQSHTPATPNIDVVTNPANNVVKFYYSKDLNIQAVSQGHNNINTDISPLGSDSYTVSDGIPFTHIPPAKTNYNISGYYLTDPATDPTAVLIPLAANNTYTIDASDNISNVYIHYESVEKNVTERYVDNNNVPLKADVVAGLYPVGYLYQYNVDPTDIDATQFGSNYNCYTLATPISGSIVVNGTDDTQNVITHVFNKNKVNVEYVGYDYATSAFVPLSSTTLEFSGNPTESVPWIDYSGNSWVAHDPTMTDKIADFTTSDTVTFIYTKGTIAGTYTADVNYLSTEGGASISSGAGHTGPTDFSSSGNVPETISVSTADINDGGIKYIFDHATYTLGSDPTEHPITSYAALTVFIAGDYDINVYYKPYAKINISYEITDYNNGVTTIGSPAIEAAYGDIYPLPNPQYQNSILNEIIVNGTSYVPATFDFDLLINAPVYNVEYKYTADIYHLNVNYLSSVNNFPIKPTENKITLMGSDTMVSTASYPNGYVFDRFEIVPTSALSDITQTAQGFTFNPANRGSYELNLYFHAPSNATINYVDVHFQTLATPITKDLAQGQPIQLIKPYPISAAHPAGSPGVVFPSIDLTEYREFVIRIDGVDKTQDLINSNFYFTPTATSHNIYVGYMPTTYFVNFKLVDDTTGLGVTIYDDIHGPYLTTEPTSIPVLNSQFHDIVSVDYNHLALSYDPTLREVIPTDRGFASPYTVIIHFIRLNSGTTGGNSDGVDSNNGGSGGSGGSGGGGATGITHPAPTPIPVPSTEPAPAPSENPTDSKVPYPNETASQSEYSLWREPIMFGDPSGAFRPQASITRGEVATVIYNLQYNGEQTTNTASFNDVAQDAWYYDAVNFTKDNGYMAGYPDGSFKPDQPMTRAELLVVIDIAFNIPDAPIDTTTNFTDISGHWAESQIISVSTALDLKGYEDSTFKPNEDINRGDFSIILSKATGRYEYAPQNSFTDVSPNDYSYLYVMSVTNYSK